MEGAGAGRYQAVRMKERWIPQWVPWDIGYVVGVDSVVLMNNLPMESSLGTSCGDDDDMAHLKLMMKKNRTIDDSTVVSSQGCT